MARTAHPLKRTAKGSRSSKRKRARKTPKLDSLEIVVKCGKLTCSILSIHRRYCDNAIDILKERLTEKLTADEVKEIQYLRIDTPGHHSDLLNIFSSLSIHIETLGVGASINSLENDDWVDKALSMDKLDTVRLILHDMKVAKIGIVDGIIHRALSMREARIELVEEVQDRLFFEPMPYVDEIIITDAYLLEIAKRMRQELELNISATQLTVEGIVTIAKAIADRKDAARLRFQLDTGAREFKAEILKRWGIEDVVEREFKELNKPRTNPLVFEKFTMFNRGCESLCIYDGRIVVKFPTEFVLDGRFHNKNIFPHRITIERVVDENKQLALDRGFFEVNHK